MSTTAEKTREAEGLIHLGAEGEGRRKITARVEGITTRIKKVQTSDEGKLQVTLETEGVWTTTRSPRSRRCCRSSRAPSCG
ncbi:MAG: hypothetical protein U5L11_01060 [Arhodomonas sp.]|nr:hypothetical protein [Arhodomonas sp.]